MTKPINWNEVTVGETELVDSSGLRWYLFCVHLPSWIWARRKNETGQPQTLFINDIRDWTIYDPWVDVSHECIISSAYDIYHNGKLLTRKDELNGQYKRQQSHGLRVWKRKDGMK